MLHCIPRSCLVPVVGMISILTAELLVPERVGVAEEQPVIHAVADLGHEFAFYTDGRFHRQYLPDQPVAMNWDALYNFDFSNANLLVLLGCDHRLQYVREDIDTITRFLQDGGGVLLLGSREAKPQHDLARHFGCTFGAPAALPLVAAAPPVTGEIIGGGSTLSFQDEGAWQVLVADAAGRPMLARRSVGDGTLVVGARGLAGQNPDASDDINAAWWRPLLAQMAAGKQVDPAAVFQSRGPTEVEHTEDLGVILLRYSDYLEPYAKSMADIFLRCRPVIENRMGVPLSEGMASEVVLLATGGGGFSSGRMLGLAVFWGGFPDREDSMIEFITHETVHSWVLPFPEIWNEPIATYVGNLVMIDMGHTEEAERRIRDTIARASRLDPTMTLYDLDGHRTVGEDTDGEERRPSLTPDEANDIHWGKSYWVFEQLRKDNPRFLADYFQTKRRLARPDRISQYDLHTTVAVLSIALHRNLFPWFNQYGMPADPALSEVPVNLDELPQ